MLTSAFKQRDYSEDGDIHEIYTHIKGHFQGVRLPYFTVVDFSICCLEVISYSGQDLAIPCPPDSAKG